MTTALDLVDEWGPEQSAAPQRIASRLSARPWWQCRPLTAGFDAAEVFTTISDPVRADTRTGCVP
ncbi:hypothetical protein [Amycolatopsis jejuensis]|uniref:hypothetical protein n=1 Tax=Amycolatopsis jejuensis TaxID=330084 RepID=UPI0005240BC0|nr:hypothetical protein [Amycolatopsis jejuensis]